MKMKLVVEIEVDQKDIDRISDGEVFDIGMIEYCLYNNPKKIYLKVLEEG